MPSEPFGSFASQSFAVRKAIGASLEFFSPVAGDSAWLDAEKENRTVRKIAKKLFCMAGMVERGRDFEL